MKEIIIKEANRAKLETMLKEVQGRARERLLTVDELIKTSIRLTKYLKNISPAEAAMQDTHYCLTTMEHLPKAYYRQGKPSCTVATLRYARGTWRLTEVKRTTYYEYTPGDYLYNLSEDTERKIIRNATRRDHFFQR